MKKQLWKFFYILLIIIVMAYINNANAVFLPPTPASPTLDGVADAAGGVEAVGNVTTTPMEKAQNWISKQLETINKFKADLEERVDEFKDDVGEKIADIEKKATKWIDEQKETITGRLHKKKKGESAVAVSREIKESEVADITDEESIITAFEFLFGQYPAEILKKHPLHQEGIKKLYKDKSIEFSSDALIELYITARDMDEIMEVLQKEVDGMSDKYVLGTTVEPSPEIGGETTEANDEFNSWVNYYKVSNIYDSILRISEELSALDAQYEAAQALRKGIEPKEAEFEEQKETSAEKYFEFGLNSTTSYAQVSDKLPSWIRQIDLSEAKKSAGSVITVKPRVAQSAFKGAANQFEDLKITNELAFTLSEAINVHNLIQQMENFKGPFVEYNRMKGLHQEVLRKLKSSEDCVVAHLGRYYKDPVSAWLGQGCEYDATGLAVFCDKGIKVTKEVLRNLPEGDFLCKNDDTKICNLFSINRYERRDGISGWLYSAYQVAKAEKTLEFTSDDFATQLTDESSFSSSPVGNLEDMEDVENDMVSSQEQGIDDSSLVKPTDELKLAQNDREREILAWQMGAAAAHKIGAEMVKGEESVYGTIQNKYPLWNDEKYFYLQYLISKYDNMKMYMKSVDLRSFALNVAADIDKALFGIAEETDDDEEDEDEEKEKELKIRGVLFEDIKAYNRVGLSALAAKVQKVPAPKIDRFEKIQEMLDEDMAKMYENYKNQKEALEEEIAEIYAILDEKNIELNETKKAYNKTIEDKQIKVSSINAENDMLSLAAKKSEKASYVNTKGFEAQSEATIKLNEEEIAKLDSEANVSLSGIDDLRLEIDGLKEELSQVQSELNMLKSEFAEQISKKQYAMEKQLKSVYESIESVEAPSLSSLVSRGSFANYESQIKSDLFSDIIEMADMAAIIVRNNAIAAIEKAKQDILKLGDEIYDLDGHKKIVNVHKIAMDKIKNPTVNLSSKIGLAFGYININSVNAAAAKLMARELFGKICESNKCYSPDERYYVAATPNEKDFTAPKTITPTYTPPLREIFHLDGIDYDNIDMADGLIPYMDKTGFANLGFSLPPIWSLLLEPKGFVEKDVPIIPLLTRDDEDNSTKYTDALIRGGIYPCSVGNSTIDVYQENYAISGFEAPLCGHISTIDAKGIKKSFKTKDNLDISIDEQISKRDNTISELSLFMYADEGGFIFDNKIKAAMIYLDELDEDYDVTTKNKKDNMMHNRNQFGDYLKFIEAEMEFQKSLDQLDVKIESARNKLKDEFAKFDYIPAEDFDLSDAATFKEIVARLNEEKDKRVNEVAEKLDGFVGKNDTLAEKIEKLNNTLSLLKRDNNELVSLSDSMSLDSLEEQIKREQADRDAQGGYDKEVEKTYSNNSQGYLAPYCAVY